MNASIDRAGDHRVQDQPTTTPETRWNKYGRRIRARARPLRPRQPAGEHDHSVAETTVIDHDRHHFSIPAAGLVE